MCSIPPGAVDRTLLVTDRGLTRPTLEVKSLFSSKTVSSTMSVVSLLRTALLIHGSAADTSAAIILSITLGPETTALKQEAEAGLVERWRFTIIRSFTRSKETSARLEAEQP